MKTETEEPKDSYLKYAVPIVLYLIVSVIVGVTTMTEPLIGIISGFAVGGVLLLLGTLIVFCVTRIIQDLLGIRKINW